MCDWRSSQETANDQSGFDWLAASQVFIWWRKCLKDIWKLRSLRNCTGDLAAPPGALWGVKYVAAPVLLEVSDEGGWRYAKDKSNVLDSTQEHWLRLKLRNTHWGRKMRQMLRPFIYLWIRCYYHPRLMDKKTETARWVACPQSQSLLVTDFRWRYFEPGAQAVWLFATWFPGYEQERKESLGKFTWRAKSISDGFHPFCFRAWLLLGKSQDGAGSFWVLRYCFFS